MSRQRTRFGVPMSSKRVAEMVPLAALGSYRQIVAQRRTDQLLADFSATRHLAQVGIDAPDMTIPTI